MSDVEPFNDSDA